MGTPVCTTAGGGLESDTLSLECREPSEERRGNKYIVSVETPYEILCFFIHFDDYKVYPNV